MTWTPFTYDVDCEICDVWSDVDIASGGDCASRAWHGRRPLGHWNVMWNIPLDVEISLCEFAVLCIVLVDGLCGSILSFMASYWTQDNFFWLAWWWILLGLHPIWMWTSWSYYWCLSGWLLDQPLLNGSFFGAFMWISLDIRIYTWPWNRHDERK